MKERLTSREKEIQKLEKEYQKREKELLEAFAYLGKVNVQVSLIKSFLKKLKAPSSRKEAENYINEILEIALTLSGKNWVTLRALDVRTLQTVSEYWAKSNAGVDTQGIKIGNKDIVKWDRDQRSWPEKRIFCPGIFRIRNFAHQSFPGFLERREIGTGYRGLFAGGSQPMRSASDAV